MRMHELHKLLSWRRSRLRKMPMTMLVLKYAVTVLLFLFGAYAFIDVLRMSHQDEKDFRNCSVKHKVLLVLGYSIALLMCTGIVASTLYLLTHP